MVRARVHRLAKCNKCTRESNKRQTAMMNRQTISVPSATSGDLFVIKDETTINPVERIYQRLFYPPATAARLLFTGARRHGCNQGFDVDLCIDCFIHSYSCVYFSVFFFFFWGVVYLLTMSSNGTSLDYDNLRCNYVYNCHCYCIDRLILDLLKRLTDLIYRKQCVAIL